MAKASSDEVTAFCEALWRNDAATIARLVAHIDPDGKDRWQRTPLAMAAQYSDLHVVDKLLKRGAGIDQGRTYLTPITFAARRGAHDIVENLRARGATV